MQIWAGLGNPGAQYALHRHNVGFMAVDIIAEVHGFGPWQKKFRSLVSQGRIGRKQILLLKPQTYMNDSGDAVQQALHFYKLDEEALTAFHDELDLAPFKVKVRTGGGLAAAKTQPPPEQQEEFVPIDQLPPEDRLPAAPLLISAYAVVLLALFAYVYSIARRLGSVQREVERLEGDLKRSGRG